MITDLLLYIFYWFIRAVILLFPAAGTISSDMDSAFTTITGLYAKINNIFPVDTLLICLGILITIEGYIFSYKLIKWAYNKIPGIN